MWVFWFCSAPSSSSIIHSCIHSFMHSFVRSFVNLFIYVFYFFIYLFRSCAASFFFMLFTLLCFAFVLFLPHQGQQNKNTRTSPLVDIHLTVLFSASPLAAIHLTFLFSASPLADIHLTFVLAATVRGDRHLRPMRLLQLRVDGHHAGRAECTGASPQAGHGRHRPPRHDCRQRRLLLHRLRCW